MPSRITQRARALRSNPTDTERKLWHHLRRRQICSARFRRQYPVGPYIVDFACLEHRLIVELDGSQHFEQAEYDCRRDSYLRQQGFQVLRYWNDQVMKQLGDVLEDIARHLAASG